MQKYNNNKYLPNFGAANAEKSSFSLLSRVKIQLKLNNLKGKFNVYGL